MNLKQGQPLRILFIGPEFYGSISGALARAFRRLGHVVKIVDPERYVSSAYKMPITKILRRLFRYIFLFEFGKEIVNQAEHLRPHFALVCKGTHVAPWVLRNLKKQRIYLTNFYPDTTYYNHGPLIPKCLGMYDHVFTTKRFGLKDLAERFNQRDAEFLAHGFDPGLHKPLPVTDEDLDRFGVEASFIGSWTPKKESYLAGLLKALPDLKLRIWGDLWGNATSPVLASSIVGMAVVGDNYPLAIQCSTINIALLLESKCDASSGDQATTRTFEIPACGGFMLHERTEELRDYFIEGEEVACFSSLEEMVEKIRYYLAHDEERERLRLAGHRRCVAENSLDRRAMRIVEHYYERFQDGFGPAVSNQDSDPTV